MRTLAGLWLDRGSRATLQEQLARGIKELIRKGALTPGEEIPSTRDLASGLNVSRNTAVNAYDRLVSEGYLETVSRSGVFVSSSITMSPHSMPRASSRATRRAARAPVADAGRPLGSPAPFRPSQPDVSLFPLLVWNRLRSRALKSGGRSLLHYQAACVAGLPALRQNVAAYLSDSRGVRCDWRQVVITAGSQQGLYLLAALLLGPGRKAYVEDPGYVEARLAFQRTGAKIVAGPVDDQGLRLPTTGGDGISLVYTTPSRQFPTGVSLSLSRRIALIDYAGRSGAWVVEDDYDSELRYGAPPLPSLQSLDGSGRVIYVGTFSKLLFPSLRLGYVVVPESLLDAFLVAKHLIDDHLPLVDQAALALFLESGAFYSHIRRCRRAYAERHALFRKLLADSDLQLEIPSTDGGMNLAGFLPAGRDDVALSRRLGAAGFDVPPLSRYAVRAIRPGLLFGFTAFTPAVIRSALLRLRRVLEQCVT